MSNISCSVGILTFNSGKTLRRALDSVKEFDDIVICDGGSTDDTLAIAEEYGCRIIRQDEKYKNTDGSLADYGAVRNQCLDVAKYDWFLYIDSDETISEGLREAIRQTASSSVGPLVYRVPIGILLDGHKIAYASNYPGYQTRFFNKRSGARFIKKVHEKIVFDEKITVGTCKHPWFTHTSRADWTHYLRDNAKYQAIEIRQFCSKPFMRFLLYGVWWHLRASAVVVVKATYGYLRYGFRKTLPIAGEAAMAVHPLLFIWGVVRCKLRRAFR